MKSVIESDPQSISSDEVSSSTPDECPLQIVAVNKETGKFELNLDALNSILLSPEVRDRHVAVISIAGDFRKGKSFLLNFFLRYLRHDCSPSWLDDKDVPLKGS